MALASDPSVDIRTKLAADGAGSTSTTGSTTWAMFVGNIPDTDAVKDNAIGIFTFGGPSPNPKFSLDEVSVQVRVRGNKFGYNAAYTRAQLVKDTLLGAGSTTLNATKYIGFWMTSDIAFLGYDDNNRPNFVTNWRIIREPQTSSTQSNRTLL